MPPKQVVDLDLDALAPPPRTLRLHGKVYELPGDIGIETIIGAMQMQERVRSDDEAVALEAMNELLEIIYDLFREQDPNFEPVPLTITQIVQILGLVLSGLQIDFEAALREGMVGGEPEEVDADNPPTKPKRARPRAARPQLSARH